MVQLRRRFSLDWALTAGTVSTTAFGSRNPAHSPGSAWWGEPAQVTIVWKPASGAYASCRSQEHSSAPYVTAELKALAGSYV